MTAKPTLIGKGLVASITPIDDAFCLMGSVLLFVSEGLPTPLALVLLLVSTSLLVALQFCGCQIFESWTRICELLATDVALGRFKLAVGMELSTPGMLTNPILK